MKINELADLVSAVCPIISINSDGGVVYDSTATTAQKAAAQSVITANIAKLLEPPTLLQLQSLAIEKTYSDVDSIYSFAIGSRAEEYKQAESAALAYQAAGYTGAVSEYISSWASSNAPMTNTQSADAIIARASALRSAMIAMRTQRFVFQSSIRASTTNTELNNALATWNAFITTTKATLS